MCKGLYGSENWTFGQLGMDVVLLPTDKQKGLGMNITSNCF
jgi:hypothetical protein